MKRFLVALCASILPLFILYATSLTNEPVASAEEPSSTPQTFIIEAVTTPTPTPNRLTPPPTFTPLPDLPDYKYIKAWAHSLSRGSWSVCPNKPTVDTKTAFNEMVLNRVDDESGDFADDAPHVLSQANEFLDYDPKAYRSIENDDIADKVMRAWTYYHITGSRAYMLTPADGLYCDFYEKPDNKGWDYIKIYNRAGDVVFDSGTLR